jgi:hypothetical protein
MMVRGPVESAERRLEENSQPLGNWISAAVGRQHKREKVLIILTIHYIRDSRCGGVYHNEP